MPCSIGVIGLGQMAQAIIMPLINSHNLLPEDIFAVVGSQSSSNRVLEQLPKGINIATANQPLADEVWNSPVQLLAIKPQKLDLVANRAKENKSKILSSSRPVLISILAGVTLARLKKAFPLHACVRVVPNIPILVESGLTGLVWGADITSEQKLEVQKIFAPSSEIFEMPENQLDAFLALTSSGPAYISLVIEALTDGAVAAGLPRKLAYNLATLTLEGTSLLIRERQLHPGELKDMVTSPGGTTIAGLRHLEKAGMRSALIEAVLLAAERSRQMS